MRFLLVTIIITLTVSVLYSCGQSDSSKDYGMKKNDFLNRKDTYEKLLDMFRKDSEIYDLSFISSDHPERTSCGQKISRKRCSFPMEKWKTYNNFMKELNIVWVERENPDNRFYFVSYYEPILMNARLNGIVFSEKPSSNIADYYPKQEWNHIVEGWHSFQMTE